MVQSVASFQDAARPAWLAAGWHAFCLPKLASFFPKFASLPTPHTRVCSAQPIRTFAVRAALCSAAGQVLQAEYVCQEGIAVAPR